MATPDALRKARSSYAIVLHGILRDYIENDKQLFILVEGKDADYYRPRVSVTFSGSNIKISYRNLRGKRNEKLLIKAIKGNSSLKDLKYLAFFDRDYEDDIAEITQQENYITPGYSVENLYTQSETLREVVHSFFFSDSAHNDEDSEIVRGIVTTYQELQRKFHVAVELFNHWAWAQRHMPRPGTLNLDSFELLNHMKIDFERQEITAHYDLNALAVERAPVTAGEIAIASEWFKQRRPEIHNRGKQEASFLFLFVNFYLERGARGEKPFNRIVKCTKRFSHKELIADLSAYAATPHDFVEFLRSRKECLEAS